MKIEDVLALCLPLALDGLNGESQVWYKMRDIVYDNQGSLTLSEWVLIAQSFASIKGGFKDDKFWKVVESKLFENGQITDLDILSDLSIAFENENDEKDIKN